MDLAVGIRLWHRAFGEDSRRLAATCAGAFVLRVLTIPFSLAEILDPKWTHWPFGWEMGRVARSIAIGEGFGSPLHGFTGPTALLPPLYPYMLAAVFKLFGVYSFGSAIAILVLNSVFSSLTAVPIYFIASSIFGKSIAIRSAAVWALYPFAIYFSTGRVWETSLSTLLLTTCIALTLRLQYRPEKNSGWIQTGLLWGIAALCNPNVLAVLAVLLCWILYRRKPQKIRLLAPVLLTISAALPIVPWLARNYRAMHVVVPVRDNFWMELWNGNTGDLSDLFPDWAHPSNNPVEMAKFHDLGEVGYMAEKRALAISFVRNRPQAYLWLTSKRIAFMWTGYWSFSPEYLNNEPFEIPNICFSTGLTILMCIGIVAAWRNKIEFMPLILALLAFPIIYYLTHPGMEYRHPIEPELLMFVTYGTVRLVPYFRRHRTVIPDAPCRLNNSRL